MLALVGCTILALSSGCFAQLFAHVREEYSDTKDPDLTPGLLMSIVRVCFSFSWTVGPAVGAVILVAFGFEGLFSAAALLWALFLAGVILHVPLRRRPRAEHGPARASVWKTFRRPDIAVSFIAFSVLAASQSINMMNLPLAIIRELGGTERDFGIVFGIGPIVEIPMMIWFGQLSSRGHQMRLIRLGFLVAIVYYAGLSLATEPWHVYILQILSGTMVSIVSNVAIMFFQDQLPSQPGLATALFANSQSAGNLAGVLSFGFVVEWVGHRGVFVSCIVLAVAAYFMILLYRRRDDLRAMP
jgi:SET family sugar efflux transporter-like MFS transporter